MRPAHTADIDAVLAVWLAARSAAATTPDTPQTLARLLARDPEALLVAERDGEIVGTLVAGWDGWRVNFYRLAVVAEHRRQGIARALVDDAHARLRAKGALRATALVAADEDEATGFWRAVGYAHDPQMARFVRNL
ncbi:MAG: family N-acetyltransferase [Solirubrobacterales bacterium]|nr:family N-acetyltransferase [Solirubrobacterales bacterium]